MDMAKYLDLTGLTHFWEGVKDYIDSKKATVVQSLTSGTKIGSVDGVDLYAPSGGGTYTLPTASSTVKGGVKVATYNGFVMDGEYLNQFIDVSMNGTAIRYISASTSSTVAASMNGWHINDVYADPDAGLTVKRATGVVYASAVINTSVGGQYRSSNMYIPLPEEAQGVLYVSPLGFGCGLGGSSVAGMGALLGGAASTWQYSYGNQLKRLTFMLTAPTSSTSSRNVYFPIEVLYVPFE